VTRVLVTGAEGMVGAELVRTLGSGFVVASAVRSDFDITDRRATADAVAEAAPEVVVNCAGYTDVDGAEAHRSEAEAVNARGAGHVAEAAAAVGARVIQLSTDYVFDGKASRPYLEDDAPNPINAYGETKLGGERAVAAANRDHLIVRTAWLYGHGGPNFVETILRTASAGGNLRVVDDQRGSPTNVRDLCGVLKELIATGAAGVVNATNAGTCTWYTFAKEIVKLAGLKVDVVPVSSLEFTRPAARPTSSVLSLERLTELIGWTPRSWREALAEYMSER
jgi:dTDP-4-dehydrorhamnose reductase